MKRKIYNIFALAALIVVVVACQEDDLQSVTTNPFDEVVGSETPVRNKVVVISDLHLGADLAYSECTHHLPRLVQFLTEIRESKTVKELVIAGDMLDEWYVPSRNDTYNGKTQEAFILEIAKQNKSVVDAMNGIITDGKITVVYAPGNHDLLVPAEYVAEVFPGIVQSRDSGKLGLGTHRPADYPYIAVEHGHRYDFFCSPDPYSNQVLAPGSILPAGYFFTRIAVNSVTNYPASGEATPVPTVTLNSTDETQVNAFTYYSIWKYVLTSLIPVKDNFDDKIIVTKIGHYTDTLCINDILPFNTEGGAIDARLFSGAYSQQAWENRLAYNNVPVKTLAKDAIPGSIQTAFIDNQSNIQFFQNDTSTVRVVVFGHTHNPMIKSFTNKQNKACLYVNSGTWIDKKTKQGETVDQDVQNMDFVVIMPQSTDSTMLKVELFKYRKGKHVSMESKSIQL